MPQPARAATAACVGPECQGPPCRRRKAAAVRQRTGTPLCTLQGCGSTPYVSKVCAFLRKFSSAIAGVCPLEEKKRGGSAAVPWRQELQALPEALENQWGILVAGPSTATVARLPLKATATQGCAQARRRQTEAPPSGAQGSSPASEAGGRSLLFYADVNFACLIWYY